MRTGTILLLVVGLMLVACDDDSGNLAEPSTNGTLVVSTSTEGEDPDRDGYLLTVDDADSLALDPTGTAEVDVASGSHTLRLLGVEDHCTVVPATPLDVDIPQRDRIAVGFEVSCPATGARVTVTTTGLDADGDGYRVTVDGTDQSVVSLTGSVLMLLEPGTRTIALTDLAPNCAHDGPGSRTVTIVDKEVASVEFIVVCTATTGVIKVSISAVGGISVVAKVDGASPFPFESSQSAYFLGVPAGTHEVSLTAAANCSVKSGPQSVTVTAGTLTRDTVEVTFPVTCVTGLRITAPTTGIPPDEDYAAYTCTDAYSCNYERRLLGFLGPADTLIADVTPGTTFRVLLDGVPNNCIVQDRNPTEPSALRPGELRDIVFRVGCSP